MLQYDFKFAVSCRRVYRLFGIQECREHPLGDCRLLTLLQYLCNAWRHEDVASTRLGFGFTDTHATALFDRYRTLYAELFIFEVDITPFESADLTTAQACHHLPHRRSR